MNREFVILNGKFIVPVIDKQNIYRYILVNNFEGFYDNCNNFSQILNSYTEGNQAKIKLKPGQKLQIIQIGDRLEFIIVKTIKEARGFLKGIHTSIVREEDRL